MTSQKKYLLGKYSQKGIWNFVCPNCSNIQEEPDKQVYHFVEFKLGDGETKKKCLNCGALLYIKPLK